MGETFMFEEYLAQARIDDLYREADRQSLVRLAKQLNRPDGRRAPLLDAAYYLRKALEGHRQ